MLVSQVQRRDLNLDCSENVRLCWHGRRMKKREIQCFLQVHPTVCAADDNIHAASTNHTFSAARICVMLRGKMYQLGSRGFFALIF